MNRINELFERKQQNILNIYFTAGYPKLNDTVDIIKSLSSAGADLIEVGIPYSDPLADGPTIQASGSQALKNGMTMNVLFRQLTEARKTTEIPLILMGYFNQVMQFGVENFCRKCAEVGIDGVILPDLPLNIYERDFKPLFKQYGINFTFLITPQTTDERIRKIDELSDGFIYVVSSASITGAKKDIEQGQIKYFKRIKALNLQTPTLIGFGISNHETFSQACQYANGAIIGSAFIKAISNESDLKTNIKQFVNGIITNGVS